MIDVPSWQALLFVPVGAERHLASAIRHRPDAVILDLEDAIATDAKSAARDKLAEDQSALAAAGIPCVLRVNAPLAQMAQDIAAADLSRLAAILVPKCEDPRPLMNAADLSGGTVGLIALVETPRMVFSLSGLDVVPQLVGLMLGSEDYAAALGIDPDGGGLDILAANIAAAAAMRGLLAIGFPGSIANFRDLDRHAQGLHRGRCLGMNAAGAIHPAQLPGIRRAFSVTVEEIAWACRVIAASGPTGGVVASAGEMIDAPVLARATRILSQARRCGP